MRAYPACGTPTTGANERWTGQDRLEQRPLWRDTRGSARLRRRESAARFPRQATTASPATR
ncbi:hypothetical protein HPP92_023551, partial [Vanilla planifolia]